MKTKKKTITKELRAMKVEELRAREKTLLEDLMSARFKFRTGQLEKNSELPRLRREVARVKTVLHEKELATLHSNGVR